MSDFLKAILVDDWENVTKLLLVVPLPHPVPITQILQDYRESESPKRLAGSAQAATLEDFINGIGNYFNNCLGSQLLYRYVCPHSYQSIIFLTAPALSVFSMSRSTTDGAVTTRCLLAKRLLIPMVPNTSPVSSVSHNFSSIK